MKVQDGELPTWKPFENVVVKILEHHQYAIQAHSPQGDAGFDFDATFGNLKWAIEVKFYRSARAQMALIEAAVARVINNGLAAHADRAALVVSSFITPEQRQTLGQKYSAAFIDRADLAIRATAWPELTDELNAVLEARSDLTDQPRHETGSADRLSEEQEPPRLALPATRGMCSPGDSRRLLLAGMTRRVTSSFQ